MFRNSLALPILLLLASCGGGGSPVDARLGTGEIQTTVGPAGRLIRGAASTALAGFTLDIPEGAVRQLVRLTITPRAAIDLPGTRAATTAVQITAVPDPGALLVAARLTMTFGYSEARDPGNLFVAGLRRTPGSGSAPPHTRVGLAAELGVYDRELHTFTADIGTLADLQVRFSDAPRQIDDANALFELALGAFDRLTDESLVRADQLLAEALRADPYFAAGRLLRAVTRVLVVLNEREQRGPGLQSVGEAATGIGLDLRARSLLRRVVDGVWPLRIIPRTPVPTADAVLEMLQRQLRPALELGLADLAFVPPHSGLELILPKALTAPPGPREVDAADLFFLQALYAFTLYGLDALQDLVLTVDAPYLIAAAAGTETLQDFLTRHPRLGERRVAPAASTLDELTEALFALAQGIAMLNGETDPQSNDLVVFSSSFTESKRDRWQGNAEKALESLREDGARAFVLDPSRAVSLDMKALGAGLDARSLLPRILEFVPLAGTLPDPGFAGLLPGLTQDAATRLFHFASEFELPAVRITVDGDVRDWPATSEALLPVDAAGDGGELPDLDVSRVFLAVDGDDLACRLSLTSGEFRYRASQSSVYGFTVRPARRRPALSKPLVQVLVEITEDGPELTVRRGGQVVEVRHAGATRGRELEFKLNRLDLFGPGEPRRDRVLKVFSTGLDPARIVLAGDETRRILIRF